MHYQLAILLPSLALISAQVLEVDFVRRQQIGGDITINGKRCPSNPDGSGASAMNDWCCMGKIGGKVADEQKAYWSSFGESMANIGKPTGTGNGFFGRRSAQPTARAVLDRRDVTTILEGFECTGFAIPFSASDYDAQVSSFLAGNKPAGSASATASSSSAASSSNASSSGTTSAPSSAAAVATSNGSGSAKLAATSSKSTSSSKAAAAVMTQAPILGFGTVAAVAAVAAVYGAM